MLLLNQKKERSKDFPYFVPLCTSKEFESGYGSTIDVNDEVQVEAYTNMVWFWYGYKISDRALIKYKKVSLS